MSGLQSSTLTSLKNGVKGILAQTLNKRDGFWNYQLGEKTAQLY
jgi:hypothetical protein